MESLLRDLMSEYSDEANLEESEWGVPVLVAWNDKVDQTVENHLRELAKEERKRRGI